MIDWPITILIGAAFFGAALIYASVGNAGATSYLAIMALFGLAPEVMKPTALALNILVASIATLHFVRAGHFSWRIFWPFALTSIPFAYLGGRIVLPGEIYAPAAGVVLLYVAYRLLRGAAPENKQAQPGYPSQEMSRRMPVWLGLLAGAGIGLLAGLVGLGGGIFLTPLLLFTGWAEPRQAAGASAVFNLVNSLAGLAGQAMVLSALPAAILPWSLAAGVGGWIGASYGSRRAGNLRLQQALALVLVIAGLKLLFI